MHYYQPVFDANSIEASVWHRKHDLPGIAFAPRAQLAFLRELGRFASECEWPEHAKPGLEGYYSQNPSFGYSSACLLHSVVRLIKPSRVVEVGAGMSTLILAGALDVNEQKDGERGALLTIDPYPPAVVKDLRSLHTLITSPVQEVALDDVASLSAGDLLFIDSSHVVRTGGDVTFLYLDVLPRLAAGVVVHIHDIQLPFEYPRLYSDGKNGPRYFWTEQYLLQALLSDNRRFKILLAGYFLQRDYQDAFLATFPMLQRERHRPTSSFYIERQ